MRPWRVEDNSLVGEWKFDNFEKVVLLVRGVLELSEKADHHPEMSFSYRTCRIVYITHSCGGLSELDFYCARKVSEELQ